MDTTIDLYRTNDGYEISTSLTLEEFVNRFEFRFVEVNEPAPDDVVEFLYINRRPTYFQQTKRKMTLQEMEKLLYTNNSQTKVADGYLINTLNNIFDGTLGVLNDGTFVEYDDEHPHNATHEIRKWAADYLNTIVKRNDLNRPTDQDQLLSLCYKFNGLLEFVCFRNSRPPFPENREAIISINNDVPNGVHQVSFYDVQNLARHNNLPWWMIGHPATTEPQLITLMKFLAIYITAQIGDLTIFRDAQHDAIGWEMQMNRFVASKMRQPRNAVSCSFIDMNTLEFLFRRGLALEGQEEIEAQLPPANPNPRDDPITFSVDPIGFTEGIIMHAIHDQKYTLHGRIKGYAGFAREIGSRSYNYASQMLLGKMEGKKIIESILRNQEQTRVLNLVSNQNEILQDLNALRNIMAVQNGPSPYRNCTIHMPWIGTGLWGKTRQEVLANLSNADNIKFFQDNGINLIIHDA